MTLPNFFDDSPIRTLEQGKLLWADNKAIMRSVQNIANEIFGQNAGIVYAVYGSWGSGKTSIARIIEDEVGRMHAAAPDSKPVVFSWYYASAYQNTGDVMKTLSLRIWLDLARATPGSEPMNNVVDTYREYLKALNMQPVESASQDPRHYEMLEALAERTGRLTEFGYLLRDELAGVGYTGGTQRKLVLVIDDLDRCSPEFIAALLQALRRLTDIENLFVILLGDRDRVLSGIRLMYPEAQTDPLEAERALEKYVNYALTLPAMDKVLLTSYVQRLIDQLVEQHGLMPGDEGHRVLMSIREHADYLWAGVRARTPRAIKRAANAIRTPLQLLDETSEFDSEAARRRVQFTIKRALLEYSFPDFFADCVLKAEANRFAPERDFLYQLENACEVFAQTAGSVEDERDRRARFDLRVNRYRANLLVNDKALSISDELATLLAQPPKFQTYLPSIEETRDDSTAPFEPLLRTEEKGGSLESRLSQAEEFTRLYLASEQADATGDSDGSVRAAYAAFQLIKRSPETFGAAVAPQLGNLGVNAEKHRQPDVANAIFELAYELDPNHVGVVQQYASFLIDNREAELDKAEALLNRLRQPPFNEDKLSRTMSLLVQLYAKQGRQVDDATVNQLLQLAAVEPSLRRIGSILTSLIRAGNVDAALNLYHQTRQRFTVRAECIELKRYLADALANRREQQYEFIAMDIYQQSLTLGEVPEREVADVKHNLATLYYKHDYDREAGVLWYDAYNRRPQDGAIRRAYSLYLLRANALEEAQAVIESKPITEMKLYQTSKVLPARFAPDFNLQPCADATTPTGSLLGADGGSV